MKKIVLLASATMLAATPAMAQDTQSTPRDTIGSILSALFGERTPSGSLESQWNAGYTPLTNQRGAFEAQVDADVRSGKLTSATAARLKYDYYQLTQLEQRYGSDRQYSAQEREELNYGYAKLTQVLADGSYADNAPDAFTPAATASTGAIAQGRTDFEQRVNAAVTRRDISYSDGTQLKAEYTALIDIEAAYRRDGVISSAERADLDARLAALDARIDGDRYNPSEMTARERLTAIATAANSAGLSSSAMAQLKVQHDDLSRLEQAYGRITTSADERAYLDGRLAQLEVAVGLRQQ